MNYIFIFLVTILIGCNTSSALDFDTAKKMALFAPRHKMAQENLYLCKLLTAIQCNIDSIIKDMNQESEHKIALVAAKSFVTEALELMNEIISDLNTIGVSGPLPEPGINHVSKRYFYMLNVIMSVHTL